jgi:hypothetical protein
MSPLILKCASASRPSGEWNDEDYDVIADGVVVGRIFNAAASPVGSPWMWTLAFGHHEDRTPTQLLWFEVTRHPTAEWLAAWLARQITEALPGHQLLSTWCGTTTVPTGISSHRG